MRITDAGTLERSYDAVELGHVRHRSNAHPVHSAARAFGIRWMLDWRGNSDFWLGSGVLTPTRANPANVRSFAETDTERAMNVTKEKTTNGLCMFSALKGLPEARALLLVP